MKKLFPVCFVVFMWSCVEFEQVSPIPKIDYKSFELTEINDDDGARIEGVLTFSFEDGDADLGVYDLVHADTMLPDSMKYGLFVDLFQKINGAYEPAYTTQLVCDADKVDSCWLDTLVLHKHLPYDEKLDRVGQNKTVKGIMDVTFKFYTDSPFDTTIFEFYVRDRALNKSNVERTDDFIVKFQD